VPHRWKGITLQGSTEQLRGMLLPERYFRYFNHDFHGNLTCPFLDRKKSVYMCVWDGACFRDQALTYKNNIPTQWKEALQLREVLINLLHLPIHHTTGPQEFPSFSSFFETKPRRIKSTVAAVNLFSLSNCLLCLYKHGHGAVAHS
jgi:hypothetical protein